MVTIILLSKKLYCNLSLVRYVDTLIVCNPAAGTGWPFPPKDKFNASNNFFVFLSSFF